MANGRCRLHGGKSTGPRTAEGRARCSAATWKHGGYCKEAIAERLRARVRQLRQRWRPICLVQATLGHSPNTTTGRYLHA